MKNRLAAFHLTLLCLILMATSLTFTVQAALPGHNPTRGDNPAPKKEEPNRQVLLLLPPVLTIHDFTFKASYNPGSTFVNASGTGIASFGSKSDKFSFTFAKLSIIKDLPQHGTVIAGSIEINFNPAVAIHWAGFNGKASHLYLDPGTDSADLSIALPTLWTRSGEIGIGPPPKRAFLNLSVKESNQNLELYLPNISKHNLAVLGLGDTQMLMNCQNVPLEVDLSQTQPSADPAGLSIGFKGPIVTVSQKGLANTNAGFCFGQYTANSGKLIPSGFKADFELKEKWTYSTSIPQGYEITLFPKGTTPSQNTSGQSNGSMTQTSLSSSLLTEFSNVHLQLQPSDADSLATSLKTGSSDMTQFKPDIAPDGTLRIIDSAVDTATFSGSLRLPKTVYKMNGAALEDYLFTNFHVDEDLNMRGNIGIYDPICWGKLKEGDLPVYGLMAVDKLNNVQLEPPRCFFPGGDQPKHDLTKLNGQSDEEFANQDDLRAIPGVTFLYFTLGITSTDANHPIFIPNVLPPELKQFNGPSWFFWQAQGGNNCWLNIGAAGINGKMDIHTNIGLHQYPIKLGNTDPQYANGNVQFQSYLHAYPAPKYEEPNKISGPFFHAEFIDSAVFDLGINGHLRVDGPSCIDADFQNLSATSTADLTSAAVKFKGNLKYWGVELDTGDNSKIVPRVSQVFLLKAAIGETVHYENPFPIVWGRMIGDGNIPEVIFGYGIGQSFDDIPFDYSNVYLSTWNKSDPKSNPNMPPGERWGAICTEGVLSFPYFGTRALKINDFFHDFQDSDPTKQHQLESVYEKREITSGVKNNVGDYLQLTFEIDHQTWGDPVTATFNFDTVPYYDGEKWLDGFGDPNNPLGTVHFSDFDGNAPAIIHFTGRKVRINIPLDPSPHAMTGNNIGLTLNHLQSDGDLIVDNSDLESQRMDQISEIKLKGRLDGKESIIGAFSNDFAITLRSLISDYVIDGPGNNINLDLAAIGMVGKVTTSMTYSDRLFTGTVEFDDVELAAGDFGRASGAFSIAVGESAKYIQGYGDVVIYGVPWPLPNHMAGAFFAGYGAKADDAFALGYIDGNVQGFFSGKIINGFYIAGKVGYDYSLGFLGDAEVYCNGGAGYLAVSESPPTEWYIWHGGFGAGIEIMDCGLFSSADLDCFAHSLSDYQVRGTLTYTLSLLFFDFSWSGSVWLDKDGPHV